MNIMKGISDIMKTTQDIFEMLEEYCRDIAIKHFCSTIPFDCIYCGLDEYVCPRYIYRTCTEAIERGEY